MLKVYHDEAANKKAVLHVRGWYAGDTTFEKIRWEGGAKYVTFIVI